MPVIKLEDGTTVNISIESYQELKKAVSKDWSDAVEEFHPGFMICKRDDQREPLKVRAMMIDSSAVKTTKDRTVLAFALLYNGRIDFMNNKVYFRPDNRITYAEALKVLWEISNTISIHDIYLDLGMTFEK